jgi:hypothetical protein
MSKLIERLDRLQLAAAKAEHDAVTDERTDTHDNFEFIYSLAEAYPKLRAVVEAARQAALDCEDAGCELIADKLYTALAALEEEV